MTTELTVRDAWRRGTHIETFNVICGFSGDIYHVYEVDGRKYTFSASAASQAAIGNDQPAYLLEEVFSG